MKSTVGIVGVGNMGGAMAAHLLEQGWPVQVCDLDAAKVRGLQHWAPRAAATLLA